MKLKIKNSILAAVSPVYILAYIILALIALFLLYLLVTHFQPVAAAWNDMLAQVREERLVSYIFILIFPWLVALGVVLFFWSRASAWNIARKTNPIAFLSFEETAVRLEYKKSRADVILPYAETDFSVCLPVFVTYNKYGRAFPHLAELEVSFSHAGKTYSVFHQGKLPAVQTLLDEGKKFRSYSAYVKRLTPKQRPCQEEQDFIRFLEEQLENHRNYGLLLPEYPFPRAIFTILGIVGVAILDRCLEKLALFLFKQPISPVFPIILLLIVAGLTIWCARNIKRYWAFQTAAKKLQALKGSVPR